MLKIFTKLIYVVLAILLSTSSVTFAQKSKEVDGDLKTLRGEITQIEHDNKSFTVKRYLHPKGSMDDEEVYEKTTLFVNDLTIYEKDNLLHDYYTLHDEDEVWVQYKFIPKTGKNIVVRVKREN